MMVRSGTRVFKKLHILCVTLQYKINELKGGVIMKLSNFINKMKGIAIERNDCEDDCNTVIIVKNEDGTYTEVMSDEDN